MSDQQGRVAVVTGGGRGLGQAISLGLAERGARVVAVSDTQGGIHRASGLDIASVRAWKAEHDTVVGLPGAEVISLKIGDNRLSGGATTDGSKLAAVKWAAAWARQASSVVPQALG